MKLALLILTAFAAFSEELVEVKEIPASTASQLKASAAEVASAAEAFEKAKAALLTAKTKQDVLEQMVKADGQPFDGPCTTNYPTNYNSTHAIYYTPSKKFRRVTVNGKFLLIHEGSEQCASWGLSTGTLAIGSSGTHANGTTGTYHLEVK